MKCTVLGGRGFIGGHLVRYLTSLGYDVWVPEREDPRVFTESLGHVYYCVGLTADYMKQPFHTVEAHVGLLSRILECDNYEALVYLSSTRLYDEILKGSNMNESIYFSVSPQVSRHFYDLTKLTGESLCLSMGKGKARVARLSCVYNNHTDGDGFLPNLLQRIFNSKRGDVIKVHSSINFSRDYVHIADVIMALVDISHNGSDLIYNVASGENIFNGELKILIAENSERYLEFDSDQKLVSPINIDISRIKNKFGWLPVKLTEKIRPLLKVLP